MLQNFPEVAKKTFRESRIGNRAAIFTIGMAHIGIIINFLRPGIIHRSATESVSTERASYEASLKFLDQAYGVTVVIPRTLADDKEVLRMARVEVD